MTPDRDSLPDHSTRCEVESDSFGQCTLAAGHVGTHWCVQRGPSELDRLRGENERMRKALGDLVAWIEGWRDTVDDAREVRWLVRFKQTTPELVNAKSALAAGEETP